MKKIKPAFKCRTSLQLCDWITSYLPANYTNLVYIQPFCGAAGLLLSKQPSQEEIISDVNPNIMRIHKILRDCCDEFVASLKKIRYSKESFENAVGKTIFDTELDAAVNEYIIRRMSRCGLGEKFHESRNDLWKKSIETLPIIAKRLEKVYILQKPVNEILQAFNRQDTLVYLNPPDDQIYENILMSYKGNIILSGMYSSSIGNLFKTWRLEKRKIANKTQFVCMNF